MRARTPDEQGVIEQDGVRIAYEVFGDGTPTILLLPSWSIVHSRQWKLQVPYLSRHFRVVTLDGRGNGRSDRPMSPAAYTDQQFVADALAVMDATATAHAVVVGWSMGGRYALELAAWHPQRVLGVVAIAAALPTDDEPDTGAFDAVREDYKGWQRYNRHSWRADYPGFVDFFMGQVFSDRHSTKPLEDGTSWGLETSAEALIGTADAAAFATGRELAAIRDDVRCPVLVLHGDVDRVVAFGASERVADWTSASLGTIRHGGHAPPLREPVHVNLEIRAFTEEVRGWRPRRTQWTGGRDRPPRALFVSSPIGLGHARRDLAIADELRRLRPDLQIDWLTQHPVTAVLEARGERVHPASRYLASESGHIEAECGEHDLHMFQAFRRMDEILVANFMVFRDLVEAEPFDLVIADEGWDVDHFLHENPELKRAPLAWLTDFVGWLPMPSGGPAEAALTADYNAEMVEHVARYPRLRDRSIFVGHADDLISDPLGPDLPSVRDWTMANFAFSGYVTGFDATAVGDVEEIRAELGWRPEEKICLVTVGGSGVGRPLLDKVIASFAAAADLVPQLRMVVVAGPRIDPRSLVTPAGVEVHGHVPDLYRRLAACDLSVVQGGLSTTMELVALRRPFLSFPLARHFEQQVHVPFRLARYGAGPPMDYAATHPDQLGVEIAERIGRPVNYRAVESDGAQRAAALLAELL